MAQEHFQHLFKEEYTSNTVLPIHNGFPEILGEQQQLLQRPFSKEEVKATIFDMALFKALGNDGFHASFYQKSWNIVGDSLCGFVLNFLETSLLPKGANETLLVLIPKVKHPNMISQFRPISLCNVGYKVITKTLTNRLKDIIPCITAPHESSFVPGCQIIDNILIYQEVLHSMSTKGTRIGSMLIKVDLEKAYDRISWKFIQETLEKVGLPYLWIKNIMHCVEQSERQ